MLKGLTLWNPMAWAISDLDKRIENRPWKPHKGVTHIAVHAGAKYHEPHAQQIRDAFGVAVPSAKELTSSAIVAVARVTGYVTESEDPWFGGPFAWTLDDVVKLETPVSCKGSLGLWTLPPGVLSAVNVQLGTAA